jgi:KDO2-lipid IV(A) lauroyltransferase
MNKKKGAILIAGHIGMMDLTGGKIGMSGYPVFLVGKPIKHPVIHHLVLQTRISINLGTIKHKDSIRRILKGLRRGEAIVMALDQNMKEKEGIFIDWMGRAAASVRAPAIVAKLTGSPVVAGYMFQKSKDRFELVVTEEVSWESYPDDPEKELIINTQKQSDAIQRIIYEHPELWFWIHRRWKRQPAGMSNPYAHVTVRKKKKKKKNKTNHENTK